MPIGSYANLYYIADELQLHKPKSVLDLGVGFGMNGVLVRQYLDMGVSPDTLLHGVEIFYGYRNPTWNLYDNIKHESIQMYLALATENYDCILMTDVIEHLSNTAGRETLRILPRLLNKGGFILVSTPGVFVTQGPVNENEHERHLSYWKPGDFPPGWQIVKPGTSDQYGHRNLIMKYVKP